MSTNPYMTHIASPGEGSGKANVLEMTLEQLCAMASFPWSDDCLTCLCGFPHTPREHWTQVLRARDELREQMAFLKREYGEDDED